MVKSVSKKLAHDSLVLVSLNHFISSGNFVNLLLSPFTRTYLNTVSNIYASTDPNSILLVIYLREQTLV